MNRTSQLPAINDEGGRLKLERVVELTRNSGRRGQSMSHMVMVMFVGVYMHLWVYVYVLIL